ncbi:putative disease resistance RPP13-like protein 3 [Carex rostrata]
MAEGIVNLVLGKLSDVAVKEVLQIQGVGKQVKRLDRELSRIKAFLKDADMKQIVNEREKQWVKEVRDVAYDIEDVIDNVLFLKVPENPSRRGRIVGAAKRMWWKCKNLPALHNLADKMNDILTRIQEINESRLRYGINSLGEGSGERPRLPVRPPVLPNIDDPHVVGFDHDRDNIVSKLLDPSIKRHSVISIVGPGGIGKTTLAREVYNSNDVKRRFDVCIWVTISQEFKLMDILRNIIEQVEPLYRNDLEGGEEYLLIKLYKTLNGEKYTIEDHLRPNSHDPQANKKPQPKKYLLVLDDMWRSDLWTQIGEVLPDAGIGSRVIVTTRIQNIIDDAEQYKLPYLTEKPSLELFMKKALPNQDLSKGYPNELYEVGKKFVKKCGGLPLALLVLGGLLSKKPANYASWSKMLETMNWGTDGRDFTEMMATSYVDLSFVLKYCFMYFAAFPEDYEISAETLFRLWIAEGFIPVEESRTFEDTAESLLEELVQRLFEVIDRKPQPASLHAVIEVNPDALTQAACADLDRENNSSNQNRLHGIPVLLNDNIGTSDKLNTTAGSFALLGSVVFFLSSGIGICTTEKLIFSDRYQRPVHSPVYCLSRIRYQATIKQKGIEERHSGMIKEKIIIPGTEKEGGDHRILTALMQCS